MDRYLVMDLENPNLRCNSICQIAYILIEDDHIIKQNVTYIDPEDYFDAQNIDVHGITEDQVVGAPALPEYWEENKDIFNNIIVGHNIKYDLSVLSKALDRYSIEVPSFDCVDTMELAKKYIDATYYKLEYLSLMTGYHYKPHDALEDVSACLHLFRHILDNYTGHPPIISYKYTVHLSGKLDENLTKSINNLYGIIQGIVSDQVINDKEISYLRKWAEDNRINKQYKAFNTILSKLDEILEDGIISNYEKQELMAITQSIKKSRFYNESTLALQVLNGFIEGIVSDEEIKIEEIKSLQQWLHENEYLTGVYPYDKVLYNVNKVLEDGILTVQEKAELNNLFDEILHPIKDDLVESNMKGKTFCLTGNFIGYSRSEVSRKLQSLGAIEKKSVIKKLDYLFVGGAGSQAWKFGEYGGKVLKAKEIQDKGGHVKIIGQNDMGDLLK